MAVATIPPMLAVGVRSPSYPHSFCWIFLWLIRCSYAVTKSSRTQAQFNRKTLVSPVTPLFKYLADLKKYFPPEDPGLLI